MFFKISFLCVLKKKEAPTSLTWGWRKDDEKVILGLKVILSWASLMFVCEGVFCETSELNRSHLTSSWLPLKHSNMQRLQDSCKRVMMRCDINLNHHWGHAPNADSHTSASLSVMTWTDNITTTAGPELWNHPCAWEITWPSANQTLLQYVRTETHHDSVILHLLHLTEITRSGLVFCAWIAHLRQFVYESIYERLFLSFFFWLFHFLMCLSGPRWHINIFFCLLL